MVCTRKSLWASISRYMYSFCSWSTCIIPDLSKLIFENYQVKRQVYRRQRLTWVQVTGSYTGSRVVSGVRNRWWSSPGGAQYLTIKLGVAASLPTTTWWVKLEESRVGKVLSLSGCPLDKVPSPLGTIRGCWRGLSMVVGLGWVAAAVDALAGAWKKESKSKSHNYQQKSKHNKLETYSSSSIKRDPLEKTSANEIAILGPLPLAKFTSILTPQGLL